ncbi:MAG: hypothetical protein ACLPTF_25325 [Steroidobacteraceae bacterium]
MQFHGQIVPKPNVQHASSQGIEAIMGSRVGLLRLVDGDVDGACRDSTVLAYRTYGSAIEQSRRTLSQLWDSSPQFAFMFRLHIPEDFDRKRRCIGIYERVMSRTHE